MMSSYLKAFQQAIGLYASLVGFGCESIVSIQIQMIYANFFSPSVVATLFCLHQCTVEGEEKNPRSLTIQFLISKILGVTDASSVCLSTQQFERELESATGDMETVGKYRQSIGRVGSFNDFYRDLSKMLKTLRSLRNNKLEQGNLIDFLVRRLYIYFQKLDFKEIIGIYEQFERFRANSEVRQPQHEFMLTRSIEEVKFNLENYGRSANPEEVSRRVSELKEYDHTNKSSYLWSLVQAGEMNPIGAVSAMHRYFDKSLGNLFQEKTEVSLMSNKINHCILSGAFLQLKMHFLEECLQSVSEGLRISQNNSDEESINNCIIYLYRVSEQLGRHEQQILLNEHAITHSLNLSNALLMVYSCLSYSLAERFYDTNDPGILLLKHRSISWTDALHFSRKKVFSTFESNCKNIYHTHRSLLIPAFMCKLAVLAHLPALTPLLLNPYYRRPQLFELEVYRQFQKDTPESQLLAQTLRYCRCHQGKLLQQNIRLLRQAEKEALSPLQIIRVRLLLVRIRLEWSAFQVSHGEAQTLVDFCQKYGFVKEEMMEAWLLVIQILLKEGMYHDALVKVQLLLNHARSQKLPSFQVGATLLGLQGRLHLGIEVAEAADTLQTIEMESDLLSSSRELRQMLIETKVLLVEELIRQLSSSPDCYETCQQLRATKLSHLESLLSVSLECSNLAKVKHVLLGMSDLLLAWPAAIPADKHDRIRRTLTYSQKALKVYEEIDEQAYEEEALLQRVLTKLRALYFS